MGKEVGSEDVEKQEKENGSVNARTEILLEDNKSKHDDWNNLSYSSDMELDVKDESQNLRLSSITEFYRLPQPSPDLTFRSSSKLESPDGRRGYIIAPTDHGLSNTAFSKLFDLKGGPSQPSDTELSPSINASSRFFS